MITKMAIPTINVLLLTVSFALLGAVECSSGCEGCNAYECMDEVAHCGSTGYLLAFGEKNCEHFHTKEVFARFDEDGQKFVNCTGNCLITTMGNYVQSHKPSIDCAMLKNAGFQSHPKCYLDCGFCQVCKTNKWALLQAYDYRDFLSLEAIRQVYDVIQKCGLFNCFLSNDNV